MMISFNVFNVKVYIAITQVFAYELPRPQTLCGNVDIFPCSFYQYNSMHFKFHN